MIQLDVDSTSRRQSYRLQGLILAIGTGALVLSCASGESTAGLEAGSASRVISLSVSPSSIEVESGVVLQFTVNAQHEDGSTSVPSVSWVASGGEITAEGVFTAGQAEGDFSVSATMAGTGLSKTSAVTVVAASSPIVTILVSPASANLLPGEVQPFVATALRGDGSSVVPSVNWAATGGTISSAGSYGAGGSPGSYLVVATQQAGVLADTAVVVIGSPPPVLEALVLTPSTTFLVTGGTQQFTVSGQWSDGGTAAPAVTYAATGGSINSSGLYTVGSTAGTFQVIATSQEGGPLADTSVVTVTALVLGSCPNRPASYTTTLPEFDFSAAVPAGGDSERQVSGTAWSVIYDGDGAGGSNFSRMTDGTAPRSPADIWRLRQPAGDYGTLGSGGGTGFGNLFRNLPANTTALYACWYSKFSSPYYFHPISHKYVNLFTSNGHAFYVQLARAGKYWEALDGASDYPFPTLVNQAPVSNTWILQEVQVVAGNPGLVRVWINGQLRTEGTNHSIGGGGSFIEFGLYGFMGGGGFDLIADQYQYFDSILLATP